MKNSKSIAAKLTGVISKAADTVKHAVSHVVESASEAAQHAMEANAEKIARIPPATPDPEKVAGVTNEQVYLPEAGDGAATPETLIAAAPPARNREGKASAKKSPAKAAKAASGKLGTKTTAKKAAKPPGQSSGKPRPRAGQ